MSVIMTLVSRKTDSDERKFLILNRELQTESAARGTKKKNINFMKKLS